VTASEPQLGQCEQHPRLDAEGECLRRIELARDGVLEWWENRLNGLEQGFNLEQRPSGTGNVRLLLAVEGATAELAAGNQALIRLPDGSSLTYDDLQVTDATGRALNAALSLEDGHLTISINDTDAQYPITVDPVVSSGWDVSDSGSFGGNGWPPNPMAPAGDINGDGYDDVVIGAWAYSAAGQESGRAFVYYGSATGLPKTASWHKDGSQEYNMFGFAVSTAGDVNGDGYADVLIGEPMAGPDIWAHRGGASIYTGSATGLGDPNNPPFWRVDYDKDESWFGFSVACAGDVNGDNKSDIVIGAPYETLNHTWEGMMHVYASTPLGLPTTPSYSDYGGADEIEFGYAVAGVGDVNGDGLGDIIAGAPWWSANYSGKVWGYKGVKDGSVQAAGWSAQGTQVNELVGAEISPAGDVNADGLADFLISAHYYDTPSAADAGHVMLYKGVSGGFADAGVELTAGLNANEDVGYAINAVGDLNSDGYPEVAVAGLHIPSQIFFGNSAEPSYSLYEAHSLTGAGDVNGDGSPDMLLGTTTDPNLPPHVLGFSGKPLTPAVPDSTDFKSNGTNPTTDLYGQTLVGCDVNGDGYGDLLVGAPNLNDGLAGSGKVFMYKGSAAGLTTTVAWNTTGQQLDAGWGSAIACADFNGDGYNDVAIGASKYDNDQANEGRVAIFNGSANGLPAAPFVTVESNQVGSLFGAALATGDVNGDGIADLIVSATGYDLVGKADQGRVFVYHGSGTSIPTTASLTLDGGVAGGLFGSAIGVGDINRDGYEDVIVGAEGYTNGQAQEGRVVSFIGSTTGLVNTIYNNWKPEADVAGAHLGKALTVTDFNADGYADLVVSAPLYTNGNTNEGRIFTYQGSSTGFGAVVSFTEGDKDNVKLGEHLASGDWNNDGKGDILLGYSSMTQNGALLGGVYIQPSGELLYHYEKTGWLELGLGVTFSADFNGDGLSDVAATHKVADGTQHVRIWENKTAKNSLIAVARRPGTALAIPIGGKSPSRAFDVRMFARSPNGRTRAKVQVEAKPLGTAFNGLSLVTPGTWTDTTTAGAALTTAVTGLSAAKSYHWRARVIFDPSRGGTTQTHSRWVYGGTAGLSQATQIRTP
jgi:hypothetical protein